MEIITTGSDMVLTLKGATLVEASNTEILFLHAENQRIDQATIIGGASNDAFSYIGAAAFTGAGQVRIVAQGADILVQMNTTGGAGPDSQILLYSVTASEIGASCFLL